MALPDDLTTHEWNALLQVAQGRTPSIRRDSLAFARLSRLDLIGGEADEPLRPTALGRSVIVSGSPELWSR